MKALILASMLAASVSSEIGIEDLPDGGRKLVLNRDQVQLCSEGGGCLLIPHAVLVQVIEAAAGQGCKGVGI